MKQKYFGNKIDEDDYINKKITVNGQEYTYETTNTDKLSGNVQEFYTPTDKFSARSLNRPLIEAFEDTESIYQVLQNVCKTLYGQKENGILPDIFEELNVNNISVGGFLNDEKKYIRIPSGAFFAKLTDAQAKYYKYTKTEDNQYSKDFFIDNDRNSIIVFNKPNSDLFERQLAEHFNFNLNDQDNDIRLFYEFEKENVSEVDEDKIKEENPKNDNETPSEYNKRLEKIIEQAYINNNNEKYNAKNTLKYYINVNKTSYSYSKDIYGKNIITNEKISARIPKNNKAYCYNSFELVNSFYNTYGNYLTKEDDMFSLEEVLEIQFEKWHGENNYIIFFDPYTTEDKYELTKDNEFSFSFSKRFGICPASSFNDNSERYIKLFKIKLNVNKYNYTAEIVGEPISYLSKIDRTTLDIKNINLTNLLNDLVIENKQKNINISEAHITPSENEKDNISIGMYNLGYSNTDGEKNRSLNSEGDKGVLGENNISIGSYAMKDTEASNDNIPKNNIAIGKNTLSKIGYGTNNIEIGYGNEKIKNPYYLINIGSNISKTNKTNSIKNSEYTTIIGHGNGNNFDYLNNKNTIIGFDNNGENSNIDTGLSNLNTIIGTKNNIKTLDNLNTIIGNYTNNNDIKNIKTSSDSRNLNFVVGNNNDLENVKNNNLIVGNENYANSSATNENSNNVILGNENYANDNDFVCGLNNTVNGSNELVVGKNNSTTVQTTDGLAIGNNNTINSSENDYIFGHDNTITNSVDNTVIGHGNTVNVSGENNIFIIKDANMNGNLSNAIVIGCGNNSAFKKISLDTKYSVGPIGGINYYENNTSNSTKLSEYFLNIIDTGDAEINVKTLTVNTKSITLTGSVSLPVLTVNNYISQSSLVSTLTADLQENAVPSAGNISKTISDGNFITSMQEYRTFIGSYNNGNNAVISVRQNNGYSSGDSAAKTFLLYTYNDPSIPSNNARRFKLKYNTTDINSSRELIDSYGGQTINGTLTVATLYATSARKHKTDIKPTKYNAVDEINKINVVDFYFKSDEKKENPKVGFIADDTDPIFSTKEKNSMDLYNSVGMLFKAVQELSAENKELKERIEKLENK